MSDDLFIDDFLGAPPQPLGQEPASCASKPGDPFEDDFLFAPSAKVTSSTPGNGALDDDFFATPSAMANTTKVMPRKE